MKVELLLARDNGTWDTVIVEVPDNVLSDSSVNGGAEQWFMTCGPGLTAAYRDVVLAAVYNDEPESEEESDEQEVSIMRRAN